MTIERLEAFAERLRSHHGVVGGGGDRYDAQLSLEGDDLAEVVTAALAVVAEARAAVGLPAWPYVELEAKTEAALDAELSEPTFPEVVGATEAARMLGVSRQRLYQLAERDDFPPRRRVVRWRMARVSSSAWASVSLAPQGERT